MHLTDHTVQPPRKRRGLVDGVSSAFKWLFGTPDANDAKYYSDAIKSLQNKHRDTISLMRQQIHVVTAAIVNYNNSVQTFKLNERKLNENMAKFNIFSQSVTKKLKSIVSAQATLSHITLLTELALELNEEYDLIIASILFAKQHSLHPFVITPTNLREELLNIKLESNVQFPISLNEDFKTHNYFSISKISVIFDDTNLIFIIRIPLVDTQLFTLYKLIPIPSPSTQQNVFSYVDPLYLFLMLSITRTHYGQLRDISSCIELPNSEFLCSKPTIYLSTQRPVCEVQLRTGNLEQIPVDCPTRSIKAEMEIWHQLTPNRWLYVTSNSIPATVSCEPNKEAIMDIIINGTGILELRSQCQCYTMTTSLMSVSNISTNYTNYVPNININEDDCCVEKQEALEASHMEPLRIDNANLDELRHAKHKLDQFNEVLEAELNKPLLSEHYSIFGFLTGILVVALFVIAMFYCCCRYCCDCSWLPIVGRFIPKRYGSLVRNHETRIRVSDPIGMNDLVRREQQNPLMIASVDEAEFHRTVRPGSPINQSGSSQPVVCNPYNLRPRRSTVSESSN